MLAVMLITAPPNTQAAPMAPTWRVPSLGFPEPTALLRGTRGCARCQTVWSSQQNGREVGILPHSLQQLSECSPKAESWSKHVSKFGKLVLWGVSYTLLYLPRTRRCSKLLVAITTLYPVHCCPPVLKPPPQAWLASAG